MTQDPAIPRRTFWQIVRDILQPAAAPSPAWTESEAQKKEYRIQEVERSERRQRFVEHYNSNAANFIPGRALHGIYGNTKTITGVEAQARNWLAKNPAVLEAARARGYTG